MENLTFLLNSFFGAEEALLSILSPTIHQAGGFRLFLSPFPTLTSLNRVLLCGKFSWEEIEGPIAEIEGKAKLAGSESVSLLAAADSLDGDTMEALEVLGWKRGESLLLANRKGSPGGKNPGVKIERMPGNQLRQVVVNLGFKAEDVEPMEESSPHDSLIILKARSGQEEKGFLLFQSHSPFSRIVEIFVPHPFRRKGIGRVLVTEALKIDREQGAILTLAVVGAGSQELFFYRALGFEEVCSLAYFERELSPS